MKGTYSFEVSTWQEPGVHTRFVDNGYGRDSVQVRHEGQDMKVSIELKIHPDEGMLATLHNLLASIEAAGFIRT